MILRLGREALDVSDSVVVLRIQIVALVLGGSSSLREESLMLRMLLRMLLVARVRGGDCSSIRRDACKGGMGVITIYGIPMVGGCRRTNFRAVLRDTLEDTFKWWSSIRIFGRLMLQILIRQLDDIEGGEESALLKVHLDSCGRRYYYEVIKEWRRREVICTDRIASSDCIGRDIGMEYTLKGGLNHEFLSAGCV